MSSFASDLKSAIENLAGKWTSYTAFGTFILYLMGYLTLRFQLSEYGLATNLDVFDEKYLFAGCRFLFYVIAQLPSVLLIIFVLGLIFFLPYRLLPDGTKTRAKERTAKWAAPAHRVPLVGVLFAMALVQFVMKNCLVYGSLLLKDKLPANEWINNVLLSSSGNRSLFFVGLLAGTLLTGVILTFSLPSWKSGTLYSKTLVSVLTVLLAIEIGLLPVNYGTLIGSQSLPRVSELGDEKLGEGARGWLVWENKDVLTFFVLQSGNTRALLTVPRKDAKVRIVGEDRIFCVLFGCD
jgi:hypothetical protein